MNVIIFGATGMVGSGVLAECIKEPQAQSVLVVGQKPCGVAHPKLRELIRIRSDFFDYSDARADLKGYDACFLCLGVSATGMTEAVYYRLTYDLTISAANALAELSPKTYLLLCLRRGDRQHGARALHVGAGERKDGEPSPAKALQCIHVSARFNSTSNGGPLKDEAVPGILHLARTALPVAETAVSESRDHYGKCRPGHDPGDGERIF